ncbi:MAG: CTP synthase (glutamine hydrolyzing) [Candidatus Dojkabacteria bacterium]
MQTKYIITTGGVISGLGKGLATASIGKLLSSEYKKVPIKNDGYLNVDPGTMNPIEHGEVYVLDDGGEVDMDFGHYERYLNIACKKEWNLTMGKVYSRIMEAERRGEYLGKTVQMIPHVVDTIVKWWEEVAKKEKADVMLLEIGGTVGDMENEMYLEAARRLQRKLGRENVMFVHLTYVPVLYGSGEQKSKPSQQSISLLGSYGIDPDMIICRCAAPLTKSVRDKIAINADLEPHQVVTGLDTDNLFRIPLLFKEEGVGENIKARLGLNLKPETYWEGYKEYIGYMDNHGTWKDNTVRVAICGKYTGLDDSYASVKTALELAAAENKTHVEIEMIETTEIEEGKIDIATALKKFDGVIVPGGFGSRGVEGKIAVAKYCRENNIPYLGLCYGLQIALVEFARNVCGLKDAHTTEVNPKTPYPVVDILPDKKNLENLGGTLRLGSYLAELKKGSLVAKLYGQHGRARLGVGESEKLNKPEMKEATERHRHRYEVNPKFHKQLEIEGMVFSGMSPDGELVEYIEYTKNDFFVATQAHPEFKSPNPLFIGFVGACAANL